MNEIYLLIKKLNEKTKHRNKSIFCKNQFYIKDINNFYDKIYKDINIRSTSMEFFESIKNN